MKTISLKKVSAVAVASLGFGLLSVVPAQAATTVGMVQGITLVNTTTSPVVGSAVVVNMGAAIGDVSGAANADTLTFTGFLSAYPSGGFATVTANATAVGTDGELTGVTAAVGVQANTAEAASGTNFVVTLTTAASLTDNSPTTEGDIVASATQGAAKFSFTPTVTGVHTLQVWFDQNADGIVNLTEAVQSVSITVAAASTVSAGTSTAYIRGDNTATAADATTDALAANATATASTANSAAITVSLKNSKNAAMTTGNTISATVTGPGYVSWVTDDAPTASQCSATPTYSATLGRSITAQSTDAVGTLYVCADGSSGVATIALTATNADGTTITLPSKTVTFYGAVTKIVATGVLTVGRAGGYAVGVDTGNRSATTIIPSVIIKATDKNGVVVGGLTGGITVKSSDVTVMTETATNNPDTAGATASSGGLGFYNVATNTASSAKSGGKATLTFRVVDPAGDGTTYLTSTVDFTIGGSVATETLSFDKTSYLPGESMIVTVTAKDSSGNPVYDGATSPAITFSKSVGGTAPAASVYVGGKKASSANAVFAPVISGAFSALATSGNAAAEKISAASSVTDVNAGLLTQIDALNAKIVALNALIAKIMKKLGVK